MPVAALAIWAASALRPTDEAPLRMGFQVCISPADNRRRFTLLVGYLGLVGVTPAVMKPTALVLNILVAVIATFNTNAFPECYVYLREHTKVTPTIPCWPKIIKILGLVPKQVALMAPTRRRDH